MVHFHAGNLDRWSLIVEPEGFTWSLDSTFNLVPTFAALWQNIFPGAQLANTEIEWGSVQVRSASQGCRYVLLMIMVNSGMFIADAVEKTIVKCTNVAGSGSLGRIFKLEESWVPQL